MTKRELIKLAIAEAKHIKETATKEELSKLSLEKFHPAASNRCIYGLMTGDCESDRAKQLMPKSLDIQRGYYSTLTESLKDTKVLTPRFTPLEMVLMFSIDKIRMRLFNFIKEERRERLAIKVADLREQVIPWEGI